MDRIILGASETTAATGLFISKPGQNVLSCSPSELLFDSTSSGFFQIFATGEVVVPASQGILFGEEGIVNVYTTAVSPHYTDDAVFVSWSPVIETANANPALGGRVHGGSEDDEIRATSSFSSIGTRFIDDINSWRDDTESNQLNPSIGLVCETYINTTSSPNMVDLVFRNGASVNDQHIFYTVFRETGL